MIFQILIPLDLLTGQKITTMGKKFLQWYYRHHKQWENEQQLGAHMFPTLIQCSLLGYLTKCIKFKGITARGISSSEQSKAGSYVAIPFSLPPLDLIEQFVLYKQRIWKPCMLLPS